MPRLDLNLLRIFDVVMRERNVTRAATALHMTQPAVSNAIRRLRDALGDPLFVKVRMGIAPTLRAEQLWMPVRETLARLDGLLDQHVFDPSKAHATLRFAMSDFIAELLMRPLLLQLQSQAPGIGLHLRPHGIENVTALLEHSEIDMAVGVFSNFESRLKLLPIMQLNYLCVMRKNHPLLKAGRLTMDAFLRARHLVVSLAGGTSLVDQELAALRVKRQVAMTINHFSLAPRLLSETDLICILPSTTVRDSPYARKLAMVTPPCSIRDRTVSLLWHERADSEPLHRWAREVIVDICAQRQFTPPGDPQGIVQAHSY